jgi:hypothetical protein
MERDAFLVAWLARAAEIKGSDITADGKALARAWVEMVDRERNPPQEQPAEEREAKPQ